MARQQKGGAVSDTVDVSGAVAQAVELVAVSGGTLTSLVSSSGVQVTPGAGEVASFFDAIGADVDISVKGSAGYLLSVVVTNTNAAVRFLQLHNKASAPTNPDVPVMSIKIPIGAGSSVPPLLLDRGFFGEGGRFCSTGIAIGISTTEATFTAATVTDHDISGSYV